MEEGFELTDKLVGAFGLYMVCRAAGDMSKDSLDSMFIGLLTLYGRTYSDLEKMKTEEAVALTIRKLADPKVMAYLRI